MAKASMHLADAESNLEEKIEIGQNGKEHEEKESPQKIPQTFPRLSRDEEQE